jgi:hypothetical protein
MEVKLNFNFLVKVSEKEIMFLNELELEMYLKKKVI